MINASFNTNYLNKQNKFFMSSPKEKAKELIDKFTHEFSWLEKDFPVDLYRDVKQCALIAVEEKIDTAKELFNTYGIGFLGSATVRHDIEKWKYYDFLQKIKEEIDNL